MIIRTKQQFLALAAEGHLFNQMPSWGTIEEVLASDHHRSDEINAKVMIRYRESNSPYMRPSVRIGYRGIALKYEVSQLVKQGAKIGKLYYTQMSPLQGRLLNAELCELEDGLHLHYSTMQTHVREALEPGNGRHASRSAAWAVLAHTLCPNSMENVRGLLEKFPGHSIELTAFARAIGSFAHTTTPMNTVVWEIRMY